MKNTIIKYGLISGGILATLMIVSTLIIKNIGYDKFGYENAVYVGYSTMIAAMSVVYFGIKSFRDKSNDGKITFGKAFLIGLGIMLISCVIYSLAWLVVYYNIMPTFMDDYINYYVGKIKSSGGGQAEIDKLMIEMDGYKEMYKNPFSIFAITLLEPLPVGLLFALVSAAILRRK